jgi:hypothetical protein
LWSVLVNERPEPRGIWFPKFFDIPSSSFSHSALVAHC